MFTDKTGVRRYKIGLHTHTTLSDGHCTPDDTMALYARAGYDMLALTDHWHWGAGGEYVYTKPDGGEGRMKILSGCEYNVGGSDSTDGVYHILGLDASTDPGVPPALQNDPGLTSAERAREIIRRIHAAGGLAVLAHPAWSLNTPADIAAIGDFDATEIYNSVSDWGMSDRPYSGIIVDQIAATGIFPPLLATDDTHYYDGDQCRGMIMAETDAVDRLGLAGAIRANRFYATMGPEIHLERVAEDRVRLTCSPAVRIAFPSHLVWTAGRMVRGENLCEAEYTFKPGERFVRAEITTADGLRAWSPIIVRADD